MQKRRPMRKAAESEPAAAPAASKTSGAETALPAAHLAELGAGGAAMPSLDLLGAVWRDRGLKSLQQEVVTATGMNSKIDNSGLYSKLPGPLPGVLSHENLQLVKPTHWVTAKLDGVREMLFVTSQGSFLIDRLFTVRKLHTHLGFLAKNGSTLLDGELCWDAMPPGHAGAHESKSDSDGDATMSAAAGAGSGKAGAAETKASASSFRFMAFDCVLWDGANVASKATSHRLGCLEKIAALLPAESSADLLPVLMKPMFRVGQLPELLKSLDCSKPGEWSTRLAGCTFFVDGLVFMAEEAGYSFSVPDSLIKWKEIHTIDVLTDPADWSPIPGVNAEQKSDSASAAAALWYPVNVYHLGLNNDRHDARRLHPLGSGTGVVTRRVAADVWRVYGVRRAAARDESAREAVSVVVECAFDPESKRWLVLKPREDKDAPNYINIIKHTLKTINKNLSVAEMLNHMTSAGGGAGSGGSSRVAGSPSHHGRPSPKLVGVKRGRSPGSQQPQGEPQAQRPKTQQPAGSGQGSPGGRGSSSLNWRAQPFVPGAEKHESKGGAGAGASAAGGSSKPGGGSSGGQHRPPQHQQRQQPPSNPRDPHPSIQKVAQALVPLIEEWRSNGDWELEARVLLSDGFQGELSDEAYQQVLRRQTHPPHGYGLQFADGQPVHHSTIDSFYRIPGGELKGEDGKPVRVRVSESKDAKTGARVVSERMIKTLHRVAEIDLQLQPALLAALGREQAAAAAKLPRFYIRLTAKSEEVLPVDDGKGSAGAAAGGSRAARAAAAAAETPSEVRSKRRQSFSLKKGDFRLDFTQVQTGDTRTLAFQAPDRPEIEVELLRGEYLKQKPTADLAGSLLHKLLHMLGLPVPATRCSTNGVFDAAKKLLFAGYSEEAASAGSGGGESKSGGGGGGAGSAGAAGAGAGAGAAGDGSHDFRAAEKKLAKKASLAGFDL